MGNRCRLNCVLACAAVFVLHGFGEIRCQVNIRDVNPRVDIGVTFLGEATEDSDRTKDEYWTYLDREDG